MTRQRDELSRVEHPTTIAAVVPVWLQDALAVLLKSDQSVRLVACTATIQTMLLLSLGRSPDVVLLDAAEQDEKASSQVRQIKTVWPDSRCIVLVEHGGQQSLMQASGADEVLLKGASSEQLFTVIHRVAQEINVDLTRSKAEDKESNMRRSI
jgi:DNA-binding NarL/FixJ family response regulator